MKTVFNRPVIFSASVLAALFMSGAAFAHDGGSHIDLLAGLTHPITGIDHLLPLLSVGLIAANARGLARHAIPLAFVAVMAMGAVLGALHIALPWGEISVGLSIILLGGLLVMDKSLPKPVGAVLVTAFALFHGYSHGSIMTADWAGLTFGAAMLFTSLLLILTGRAAGLALTRRRKAELNTVE